ncbi:MAG: DUF3179 domain-containing protein [Rhodospirillales bacterium]|nr:DUF3179 domain-containing protein [Rhodospirillales bacterium]
MGFDLHSGILPRVFGAAFAAVLPLTFAIPVGAGSVPEGWRSEWPRTDFTRAGVAFSEIMSGGPPKDGIPAIDRPKFVPVAEARNLKDMEPVVGFVLKGEARAYPLAVLIWHEIVNDVVAGVPVAVTYCPLCNSAVVFDRRLDGRVLDFGTTGKLRHSDLVMYDRQTESWWQQFLGEAIVGELAGRTLKALPSRLESFADFRARAPSGRVLVPNDPGLRRYGANPYAGYDTAAAPFLYQGPLPAGIAALERVVAVGREAWPLARVRARGMIERGDLRLTWRPGQASALDSRSVAGGRDVGGVVVERRRADGTWEDAVHDVVFAFAFAAFHSSGAIHLD